MSLVPGTRLGPCEIRARFEREAKTVSSLSHPHICTLHDVGREGETNYLVMELIEGETSSCSFRGSPMAAHKRAKRPVSSISALRIPGSVIECPESPTTTSFASGQARCRSQAERIGHTTS